MRGKYKKIIVLLLYSIIGVLIAVIVPVLFPNLSIPFLIVSTILILGFVGNGYMPLYSEKFPGPSGDLATITIAVSSCALLIAGTAFLDSSRDSKISQLQLDELKKISQTLESKN